MSKDSSGSQWAVGGGSGSSPTLPVGLALWSGPGRGSVSEPGPQAPTSEILPQEAPGHPPPPSGAVTSAGIDPQGGWSALIETSIPVYCMSYPLNDVFLTLIREPVNVTVIQCDCLRVKTLQVEPGPQTCLDPRIAKSHPSDGFVVTFVLCIINAINTIFIHHEIAFHLGGKEGSIFIWTCS